MFVVSISTRELAKSRSKSSGTAFLLFYIYLITNHQATVTAPCFFTVPLSGKYSGT